MAISQSRFDFFWFDRITGSFKSNKSGCIAWFGLGMAKLVIFRGLTCFLRFWESWASLLFDKNPTPILWYFVPSTWHWRKTAHHYQYPGEKRPVII